MRLVLWDIDGTLLRAGPVAAEIFDAAVTAVTGLNASGHGVSMSGKTDPRIAAEILATLGVDEQTACARVPAILDQLVTGLAAQRDRVQRDGWVMPGVSELLAELATRPGVCQSVLTGNVAGNARTKIAGLGLDGWFDWRLGAFGSDHSDRGELVRLARQRAVAALGADPDPVWVVGDTPNDLACARAGGARCVLVATGRFHRGQLEGLGAEAVVDDLTDTRGMAELLAG